MYRTVYLFVEIRVMSSEQQQKKKSQTGQTQN